MTPPTDSTMAVDPMDLDVSADVSDQHVVDDPMELDEPSPVTDCTQLQVADPMDLGGPMDLDPMDLDPVDFDPLDLTPDDELEDEIMQLFSEDAVDVDPVVFDPPLPLPPPGDESQSALEVANSSSQDVSRPQTSEQPGIVNSGTVQYPTKPMPAKSISLRIGGTQLAMEGNGEFTVLMNTDGSWQINVKD